MSEVNHQYSSRSRGYKTKGADYKDRYRDKECPECKHGRAYADEWRTRIAYTCLKRSCRHKWYEVKEVKPVQETEVVVESIIEPASGE